MVRSPLARLLPLLLAAATLSVCRPSEDRTASAEASTRQDAPAGARVDSAALAQLVDSVMRAGMADEQIPGAAVLVLHHGRVVLSRGYGFADVASRRPVDPRSTRWPFASVTKVVTATALMQIVERGRVDLDADVNRYLKVARVPDCPGCGAITSHHLLTHTDALDELPGRRVESQSELQPLAHFLRTRLVRIGPPGGVTRYGSYGIALAGVLIEDVSGVPYPEYLRRELFAPLGMQHTTIDLPIGKEREVATPYELEGDSPRAMPYEWYHTCPTSSLVSTVEDMGRFAALHLEAESGNARVLGDTTIREMAAQQATVHPQVPGWGYGWQRNDANGRHVVEHGGDIGGFSSLVTLLPDEEFAIVVVHHLEGSNLRFDLKQAILDRFFPDRRQPMRTTPERRDLSTFAGTYLANNYCRSCPGGAEDAQSFEITANPDGSLELWGAKWREAAPLLFVDESGRRKIGFQRDAAGNVAAVSAGAWRVLERAPATVP